MNRIAAEVESDVSLNAYIAVAVNIYGSSIVTTWRPKPPPPYIPMECRSSLVVVWVFHAAPPNMHNCFDTSCFV